MSAIILESSLVHYEALGRGRPLLFLHDWLGSWRYWVPSMIELSSSYRAYAIDFWGFGDSDKLETRYSIDDYVNQVELFTEQMGIVSLPLVGHGLGGIVALRFAALHPETVSQVMAINVPFSNAHLGRSLAGFSAEDGDEPPAMRILGRRINDYEEVRMEARKTAPLAVARTVRSFVRDIGDLDPLLEELEMPVMLVYGGQNNRVQVPSREIEGELEENVSIFVLPESAHYPMLEETSKFDRLLLDFLLHKDNWDAIQVKEEWRRRMR